MADQGLPSDTPRGAVWCLIGAMVAATSPTAAPWGRTLFRLLADMRCLECDARWAIADLLRDFGDENPVTTSAGDPPTVVVDAIAGFPVAPGRRLTRTEAVAHVRWRNAVGAVRALAQVAGRPQIVAGTAKAATILDVTSGSVALPPLRSPVVAVTSVPRPGKPAAIVTADDDGSLHWWDSATGRRIGRPRAGRAQVLSLAPVPMPPLDQFWRGRAVPWLAALRDGRTLIASGDAVGAVALWDPRTRRSVRTPIARPGQSAGVLATVERSGSDNGCDVVAVHDGRTVAVWPTASVHGAESTMAPESRKLAAIGHRQIVAAAASPRRLGYRAPVLFADRSGLVSMWEPFGVRLGDPLPPDDAHREVVGMAVVPDAGEDITVVTASRTDRNLRLWRPGQAGFTLVDVDVEPTCLLAVDDTLIVGHEFGVVALTVT